MAQIKVKSLQLFRFFTYINDSTPLLSFYHEPGPELSTWYTLYTLYADNNPRIHSFLISRRWDSLAIINDLS